MRAIADLSTIPPVSNLSRRAALGGLAVLAAPISAGAPCVLPELDGPDAVTFAAVRRYEAAHKVSRSMDVWPNHPTDEEASAVCDEQNAALAALMAMTPQTVAGCAAALRCVQMFCDQMDSQLLDEWFPPLSGPAKTLLGRVAASLEGAQS